MMKKTMVLWFAIAAGVGAFALLAHTGSAPAQAVEPDPGFGPAVIETFAAVDQINVRTNQLRVRGLLLGGSDVVDRTYSLPIFSLAGSTDFAAIHGFAQRCERLALLMLTKPGAYQLEFESLSGPTLHCTLRRNE
jgi:hypothetical protein